MTEAWTGQARIENKIKNNSNTTRLDFVAREHQFLRVDVSAAMGLYLATVVVRKPDAQAGGTAGDVQILLARERKFYAGPVSDTALQPVLGVALNPLILESLLYDTPPSPRWRCEHGADAKLSKCVLPENQIEMVWQSRTPGGGKVIKIDSPKVLLLVHLEAPRAGESFSERTFQISVPSGFKRYELN